VQVTRTVDNHGLLRSQGLSQSSAIPIPAHADLFAVASEHLHSQAAELNLSEKLLVLDHLDGYNAKLDISGGDPLVVPDNWTVLEAAVSRFGKTNVTLTATGRGIRHRDLERLSTLVGEFNFTYEVAAPSGPANRPSGYATSNLHLAATLAKRGVATRAELPLTTSNCTPDALLRVYSDLAKAGIDKLLVMRLFPVGRGRGHFQSLPTKDSYLKAIQSLREMEKKFGRPRLHLQCALRHLVPEASTRGSNPCDLLSHSLGLMADGTLLLSPWAIGATGAPLSSDWVIGNLAHSTLSELLSQSRLVAIRQHLDVNFGHCKVFAYMNSQAPDGESRLLDRSDPLFVSETHPPPSTVVSTVK
jgi:MoaA/NifB/PqqE/SkfB family radical SAM enzyme